MSEDIPYIAVHLGYGAFGVGAGTYNDLPAIVIVPPADGKTGEIGTDMIHGVMTKPFPGTIIVAFRDKPALQRHIVLLEQLRDEWQPSGDPA